eukprot:Lithocolla_globosa_v1_NODE_31_length_8897_cov_62.719634.p2 type:complete len:503 gc:universal NODE_31_length_8897_cov_62.719634:2548-1040(-)
MLEKERDDTVTQNQQLRNEKEKTRDELKRAQDELVKLTKEVADTRTKLGEVQADIEKAIFDRNAAEEQAREADNRALEAKKREDQSKKEAEERLLKEKEERRQSKIRADKELEEEKKKTRKEKEDKKISGWENGDHKDLLSLVETVVPGNYNTITHSRKALAKILKDSDKDILKMRDTKALVNTGRAKGDTAKVYSILNDKSTDDIRTWAKSKNIDVRSINTLPGLKRIIGKAIDADQTLANVTSESFDEAVQQENERLAEEADRDDESDDENKTAIVHPKKQKKTRKVKQPAIEPVEIPANDEAKDNNDNQDDNEVKVVGEERQSEGKIDRKQGLWNTQIAEFMKDFSKKGFKAVVPADKISEVPFNKSDNKISLIANTGKQNESGKHWVAILITKNPPTIEFFDSFGEEMTPTIAREVRQLVKKYNPGSTSQLKINRVQLQGDKSSTCGAHCMVFLKDRLVNNKTFMQSTKFDIIKKVAQGESKAQKLLDEIDEFDKVRV